MGADGLKPGAPLETTTPKVRPIAGLSWRSLAPKTRFGRVLARFHTNPPLGQESETQTGPHRGPVEVRDIGTKERFVCKRTRTSQKFQGVWRQGPRTRGENRACPGGSGEGKNMRSRFP
jgi:hypothetical protein